MITLHLDWREVLWWMQGGMAGSHARWSVYEDMVNKVWPQCDEQTRRNIHYIMRRDLGSHWRPDGFDGYDPALKGEGAWKADDEGFSIDHNGPDGKPVRAIYDLTPWMYFRQVLARFDPDNQYAVTMPVHNANELDEVLRLMPAASIISSPKIPRTIAKYDAWHSDTAIVTLRTYKWKDEYSINWDRRCDESRITKVERIDIPDTGVM